MKIVDTIKRKYFPHKVKLIAGEERTYLTELDKAFIYACKKLNLLNNRLGWFHPKTEIDWLDNYTANKYDFFKFNMEVQSKCWESGHLKEIVYQMIINLTDANYWKPFFRLMALFDNKEYQLGFKLYRYTEEVSKSTNKRVFKVLNYVLDDNFYVTLMSWGRVCEAFEWFFEFKSNKNYSNSSKYSQPVQEDLKNKYLRVLGISVEVSKGELKSVYRKLVLKYHPDRGGNPEKFREITEAYEYLINN